MEARSIDKKTFQLTENGQLLGELIYENLFFLKAEMKLRDSDLYGIKPVGILGSSITVTKNGTEIATLQMNWRGQMVLTFHNGQEFILKAKGTFHNKYVIENKNGENLLQLAPKFSWRKFNYNYDITCDRQPYDVLLILLGIYAANYSIASMSGAIAGMA